ncbi:PREDICTED: UPF0471 protein C1orf63 homolog [Chrysochloris asiatica]|uniref:Arginine/serine-rich protein 1 n=1 Tax=Chrysochloris asiatica TaxID=185453 RepID=A0A9B0TEF2_CHRAS|nr:PREDICTED: UPF0471 protein C1orf63 homolog [Chrysochloris asiatica]
MSNYVNDMWPGSPQKEPPLTDHSSHLSSSRSSSPSSRSSPSPHSLTRSSSRSRSRPRKRDKSRSRSRRRHQRKCRRYSRSYSRSRSRPRSRRHRPRERPHEASRSSRRSPRRSPPRYRPRSRSHSRGRSSHRRAHGLARGRRYYGFGRTVYPEDDRSRRERSRSRSRSRTPFRLTEKDRMELLEIAKANAAKALGTANFDLPASLRTVPVSKETNYGTSNAVKSELSEKLTKDGTKNPSEKSSQQRSIAFSSNNSVAKTILGKEAKATGEETSGSPKVDKKKSPYVLWLPV